MPVPPFVLDLRRHIGHALLPMVGVTGVVRHPDGQVLLGRRADSGEWALPSGILEPGEQPAPALAREIWEETRVEAVVESLVAVWAQPPTHYQNGDVAQYLDLLFSCRYAAGSPSVGDDESLEVGWFAPDRMPAGLSAKTCDQLRRAAGFTGQTWFQT